MDDKGFGYWRGVPDHVEVAWGARAILNPRQEAPVDVLYDRQGWHGESRGARAALGRTINHLFPKVQEATKACIRDGTIDPTEENEVVLIEGVCGVRFVVNTNASYGYLYMAAFPHTDPPDEVAKASWSGGALEIPKVGDTVTCCVNRIGPSVVLGKINWDDYLGLIALPNTLPDWYERQNGDVPCLLFGAELEGGIPRAS